MADHRRFDLDELTNRPGTYFNPNTEILLVVDDSPDVDHELFDADDVEEAEWVLIADEAPLDELRRDELIERFLVSSRRAAGVTCSTTRSPRRRTRRRTTTSPTSSSRAAGRPGASTRVSTQGPLPRWLLQGPLQARRRARTHLQECARPSSARSRAALPGRARSLPRLAGAAATRGPTVGRPSERSQHDGALRLGALATYRADDRAAKTLGHPPHRDPPLRTAGRARQRRSDGRRRLLHSPRGCR